MAIVVYKRTKLIDHIFWIKFGEVNEFAGGIVLIYRTGAVDEIIEAVNLTVGGV